VEPTTLCATKTSERKEDFRQPTITSRRCPIGQGTSGNSSGSMSSGSSSQLYTSRGGSTTNFTMPGADPTIWLPEFHGEGSEDPTKNLFIFENIWEAKHVMDEDRKVDQLTIIFRNRALEWFMSLSMKNLQGAPKTVANVKKELINEFQRPSSEDQYMNEMT
jgi:hypothetical protein